MSDDLLLTREAWPRIAARFNAIAPDAVPRWGKLTPSGLMSHLRYITQVSTGEISVPDKSNFLTRTVVKWLFFHVFTNWPKGKFKAPENYLPKPDPDLASERAEFVSAVGKFLDLADREPNRIVVSELVGPITLEYWRRMHGIHFRHHLRQFGV